jgi:hypothetical protein
MLYFCDFNAYLYVDSGQYKEEFMFRENLPKRQMHFFSLENQLTESRRKRLHQSWAQKFYRHVFLKINESHFAVLYSKKKTRPNFPVNILVALEIIKAMFNYTDEELLDAYYFNFLVRHAVGKSDLVDQDLAIRTLYYFREAVLNYEQSTGINLIEKVFNDLASDFIEELGLSTKMQRMDSTLIDSNIKHMSRLELVIKVLQNFFRSLSDSEQRCLKQGIKGLSFYLKHPAHAYGYQLKREEFAKHLLNVGSMFYQILQRYKNHKDIQTSEPYQHLVRCLREQYKLPKKRKEQATVRLKEPTEISATSLQNPADAEATYRKKQGVARKGYLGNVTETCERRNPTQIITDVATYPNHQSDDKILQNRAAALKEKTAVDTVITDGNYSSEDSAKVCEELEITHVATAIKGRPPQQEHVPISKFQIQGNQIIACPEGKQPIFQKYHPNKQHFHFRMTKADCSACQLKEHCLVKERQKFFSAHFTRRSYQVSKNREQLDDEQYQQLARLRPAVEATISLFKRRTNNHKFRVRGLDRIHWMMLTIAIAINFSRYSVAMEQNNNEPFLFLYSSLLFLLSLLYISHNFKKCSENRQRILAIVSK